MILFPFQQLFIEFTIILRTSMAALFEYFKPKWLLLKSYTLNNLKILVWFWFYIWFWSTCFFHVDPLKQIHIDQKWGREGGGRIRFIYTYIDHLLRCTWLCVSRRAQSLPFERKIGLHLLPKFCFTLVVLFLFVSLYSWQVCEAPPPINTYIW
jgi:hypothetical protein